MKNYEIMSNYYLDLQLFADLNTNVTTESALSPTMKTFYKTSLLENARSEHYFSQFGQKVPLPKNSGKKVEFRRFNTFSKAMTPLTEGVTPDGNKVDMTKIEKEIAQYGDYTTISDRLELEAVDPIIVLATEEHGAQAGDTIDTVTRNELLAGTNVIYAGGKTSRADLTKADTITGTLINQAATFLKKMRAPKINGDYVGIVHPSVSYDLRESEGWMEVHKYAKPEEIYNGEIGKLHGVRFVETADEKVYADGKYATLIFGKDAYGIVDPTAESMEVIVKQRGSAGTADPLDQRSTVGWKASHAAQILYDERMVRIESGSFYSDVDKEN